MSGPPRRKPVSPPPPPSFVDERPTPIATEAAPTTTTTQTEIQQLPPEPVTILAVSITAPTFKSSDQVPAARMPPPSFADAALTGPFAKTHVREGEGRTLLDMPKLSPPPPSGKITAPNFEEPLGGAGPIPRTRTREGESETVSERIQLPPGEATPLPGPPPAPPQAAAKPAAKAAPVDRQMLDRKPTEVTDPWEYRGEAPAQAASLASDYESGGVELDTSGRLVAPGMNPRGRGKREKSEVSEVSAPPVDLFSVAMDVWPDEPPQQSAPPRVDPVAAAAAAPAPPPEPDTAPRPPPARRGTPNRPGSKPPAVAHQETVLRAPRSTTEPELEEGPSPEEEAFFAEDESGVVTDERSAGDPYPTPPMTQDPSRRPSNPRRLTSDEERYGLEEEPEALEEDGYSEDESQEHPESLDGPTNIKGAYGARTFSDDRLDDDDRYGDDDGGRYAGERDDRDDRMDDGEGGRYAPEDEEVYDDRLDESTGRRSPPVKRRSRWPRRLLLLVLTGGIGTAIWLWYTGQWGSVLSTLGLH